MQSELSKSVQYLKSIGPKRAESFSKIGINTIQDLLYYFPSKYLDRTNILSSIRIVQYVVDGYVGEVTILGKVVDTETHYYNKKQIFKVRMKDATGFFECVWFQGAKFFKDLFHEGDYFAVSAKPVITKYGHLQFAHPDFDRLVEAESKEFLNTGKIIPFYRLPKQLKETNIGDFSLRRIISSAVELYSGKIEETLPKNILNEHALSGLNDTIHSLHSPNNFDELSKARHRMKFEEIFYFECMVALRKKLFATKSVGLSFKTKSAPLKQFLSSLPFELTASQLKVLSEIRKDLESSSPMNRLLQGDVGSGKTIVALISIIIAVTNGYQCAFMAPTEILADQHFKRISKMLEPLGFKTEILIGGQKKSERDVILANIASGKINLVIGTHALIEENVKFKSLGMVVIDEQHRFGVLQRSQLSKKGTIPNVLVMTATPIPRTLSMTLYGDLDVSTIDEMPKNRKPIKTILRGENKLPAIFDFVKKKASEGYQSFIVYPLVEESEKLELKAAVKHFEELQNEHLKELRVALIHGRMKWQEKENIMNEFAAGKFDVLVSTTVIEVGIDIPNANIIIINDAHRFGLSQLHQLRGRVGRGNQQAYCILVTKDEWAARSSQFNFTEEFFSPAQIEKNKASIRLNAMVKTNNGFELSEIDFKLRGPGNIFGTEQSGLPEFKHINIVEDVQLIQQAKDCAFGIINSDPDLIRENNLVVKNTLKEKYSSKVLLSHIA
ncbi:MAG: ATP-dependent DNA helicase RecG [Stygiobacter sp. RIFOXYA12_FULL_38_9]|nr:MAG: ATP-dependent DNA helicase RecG [Stygiobacter sp. GWC2_38_9]OGU84790.1 MAG: ATP-dependent DNA helicase RecG [Stygiobacter sp. RIFOXYA12_FULL_38_9]OGV15666.1 MAG: ATP-dependent DNA helicase RecG [Stygiobacter sp. RIFOXYC2_FULL_38_25]OGV80780.1 MAG: ATP-dependent DNA helicase RecG [Stygiobacter sp. GWF2_38_21]RJQ64594.1 MAG: ATP-dependent DNA helicase RecG [Stygiobacter sp.]